MKGCFPALPKARYGKSNHRVGQQGKHCHSGHVFKAEPKDVSGFIRNRPDSPPRLIEVGEQSDRSPNEQQCV